MKKKNFFDKFETIVSFTFWDTSTRILNRQDQNNTEKKNFQQQKVETFQFVWNNFCRKILWKKNYRKKKKKSTKNFKKLIIYLGNLYQISTLSCISNISFFLYAIEIYDSSTEDISGWTNKEKIFFLFQLPTRDFFIKKFFFLFLKSWCIVRLN